MFPHHRHQPRATLEVPCTSADPSYAHPPWLDSSPPMTDGTSGEEKVQCPSCGGWGRVRDESGDAAPMLCTRCGARGYVARNSLDRYEQVIPWARASPQSERPMQR